MPGSETGMKQSMLDTGTDRKMGGWGAAQKKGTSVCAGDSRFNMPLVAKKPNHILGCIKHSTEIQSEELILPLHLALQQPHLDYCMQIWSLQFKKNVQVLESTQGWATKLIKDLKACPVAP